MKYRKLPVMIEAIQYTGDNLTEIATRLRINEIAAELFSDDLIIPTLEGEMRAKPLDWIIKGVKGELYPCKPDIFEKTYEKAEE